MELAQQSLAGFGARAALLRLDFGLLGRRRARFFALRGVDEGAEEPAELRAEEKSVGTVDGGIDGEDVGVDGLRPERDDVLQKRPQPRVAAERLREVLEEQLRFARSQRAGAAHPEGFSPLTTLW